MVNGRQSRSGQHDLVFSAVLSALCCPLVRLCQLLPVYGDEDFQRSPSEVALSPHPTLSDITRHPVLVDTVTHASQVGTLPVLGDIVWQSVSLNLVLCGSFT